MPFNPALPVPARPLIDKLRIVTMAPLGSEEPMVMPLVPETRTEPTWPPSPLAQSSVMALGHAEELVRRLWRSLVGSDGVVPFGMECMAFDVEERHFGVADFYAPINSTTAR
jgi:hypothetical protein